MAPLRDTPMRVLITGAAGQIGYALAPMVARGAMLGAEQGVILHLLDIPFAAESLEGVRMELIDAAFPLVKGMRVVWVLLHGSCVESACCAAHAGPNPTARAGPTRVIAPGYASHHHPAARALRKSACRGGTRGRGRLGLGAASRKQRPRGPTTYCDSLAAKTATHCCCLTQPNTRLLA